MKCASMIVKVWASMWVIWLFVSFSGEAWGQTWTPTGNMGAARRGHTPTLLPNGQVLAVGGLGSGHSQAKSSAELYDPVSGVWSSTGSLASARAVHTATLLPTGNVLVAGGTNQSGGIALNSAELYDSASGAWTATSSMGTARYSGHTATLLPNGKVLVVGGATGPSGPLTTSAELYDAATGTWAATGSLATARGGHTATLLPNGKVLVAGGNTTLGSLASAELYDPETGTWTSTGSLATARFHHMAILFTSGPSAGRVLVAGGAGSSDFLASAELYDPATGSWSSTGSMSTRRFGPSGALLPNGKVLVAGGFESGDDNVTASAELYDPAVGTWSATGSLATARSELLAALLLGTGQVLYAGGLSTGGAALASAELYRPGPLIVSIDIKPGSFPNSINLSSAGTIPVAILSSATFDATQVDPASVALAGAAVKLIGKGDRYACSPEDVTGDGLPDLVCHVATAQFMIEPGDSLAVLEAQTFGGQQIRGEDSIQIVPD